MTTQIQGQRLTLLSAQTVDNGVPADGVAATETLTLTGNAQDGEAVTIRNTVYTWKDALEAAPYQVLIGATASDSLDNLIAAINDAGDERTHYSRTYAHPDVYAAAGAGDTMDVTARVVGTDANSYATTETMANGSWGGATLSGGVARDGISLQTPAGARCAFGFDPSSIVGDGMRAEKWSLEIVVTGTGALECDPYLWGYEAAGTYRNDGRYSRLGSASNRGHVNGGVKLSGTNLAVFRDVIKNLGYLWYVYLEILNRSGTSFSAAATIAPIYERG